MSESAERADWSIEEGNRSSVVGLVIKKKLINAARSVEFAVGSENTLASNVDEGVFGEIASTTSVVVGVHDVRLCYQKKRIKTVNTYSHTERKIWKENKPLSRRAGVPPPPSRPPEHNHGFPLTNDDAHLNMPSVFSRHPRYALFTGFLLLVTFLLLASQHTPPPFAPHEFAITQGNYLQDRLAASEHTYQRMLKDRQGLIEKFGPTRDKIMMYVAFLFRLWLALMTDGPVFILPISLGSRLIRSLGLHTLSGIMCPQHSPARIPSSVSVRSVTAVNGFAVSNAWPRRNPV